MRRVHVLLAVLAACSERQVQPVSFDDVEQAMIAAECSYEVRCGLATDAASCAAAQRGFPLVPRDAPLAVPLGRMVFDPDALDVCLAPIRNASCATGDSDTRPSFTCLTQVFRAAPGQVDGAACSNDDECLSSHCSVDPIACADACCDGTCVGSTPPPTSVIAQLGQPCEQARFGPDNCAPGTVCSYDSSTCVALPAAGDDCIATGGRCQAGLACVVHLDPSSGTTCTQLPGLGQACPDDRCGDVSLVCNAQHVCVTGSLAGGPCPCVSLDFWCNPQSQQCERLPGPGESCSRQMLCADPSTFCDLMTDRTDLCQPLKPTGGTCSDSWDCRSIDCEDGHCVAPRPVCD